jgi:hypothetical protein
MEESIAPHMGYRKGSLEYHYDQADLRCVKDRLEPSELSFYDAVEAQLDVVRKAMLVNAETSEPITAEMAQHRDRLEQERDQFLQRMYLKYPIVKSEFVWREPLRTWNDPPTSRAARNKGHEPADLNAVTDSGPLLALPTPAYTGFVKEFQQEESPSSPAPKKPVAFKPPRILKSPRKQRPREAKPKRRAEPPPPTPPVSREVSSASGESMDSSTYARESQPKRRAFIPYRRARVLRPQQSQL